jgi:flagellar hook-basal body complex protein FliE
MAIPISPVNMVSSIAPFERASSAVASQPGVFQALLKQSVQSVEQSGANTQASVDRFLSGEGEELHHVALVAQQAEISFDLFLQVKNKVVSAYQEIMRMQV